MAILLTESSQSVEPLTEQTNNGKVMYIQGIFAEAEIKNGNKRLYGQKIMEKAVADYNDNYISKRRALGELNHPDRPFPDPKLAVLITESLQMQGTKAIGKARIINEGDGKMLVALIEAGFALGVSTRGLGSLKESNGVKYVQSDFIMTAIDGVDNPSGPNCFPTPLVESSWIQKNGVWIPSIENDNKRIDENLALEKLQDWIVATKKAAKAKNVRFKWLEINVT